MVRLKPSLAWFVAALFFDAIAVRGHAQESTEARTFPSGVILIGARRANDTDGYSIDVVSPSGENRQTLYRSERGSAFPGGRVCRQGNRLALCQMVDGKGEFLVIDANGKAKKIGDGAGMISAWSPDGQQFAYYGTLSNSDVLESFLIDVSSGEQRKVELDADYIADDWHPSESVRTAMYMNPRNRMYREEKGDEYPTRQIDVIAAGVKRPLTKNPSSDNIWSRFSPDGDQVAHYGRRLIGEKAIEYAVVCGTDGSHSKEVFGFTEFGDETGLPWFRPNGPPAWSSDGSMLVWYVSTNSEPTSDGEKGELLFMSVDGKTARRLPLAELGLQGVAAVECR